MAINRGIPTFTKTPATKAMGSAAAIPQVSGGPATGNLSSDQKIYALEQKVGALEAQVGASARWTFRPVWLGHALQHMAGLCRPPDVC